AFLRRAAIAWITPLVVAQRRGRAVLEAGDPPPLPIRSPDIRRGRQSTSSAHPSSLAPRNTLGALPFGIVCAFIGRRYRRLDGKLKESLPSLWPQSAALEPFLRVTLTPSKNTSQVRNDRKST